MVSPPRSRGHSRVEKPLFCRRARWRRTRARLLLIHRLHGSQIDPRPLTGQRTQKIFRVPALPLAAPPYTSASISALAAIGRDALALEGGHVPIDGHGLSNMGMMVTALVPSPSFRSAETIGRSPRASRSRPLEGSADLWLAMRALAASGQSRTASRAAAAEMAPSVPQAHGGGRPQIKARHTGDIQPSHLGEHIQRVPGVRGVDFDGPADHGDLPLQPFILTGRRPGPSPPPPAAPAALLSTAAAVVVLPMPISPAANRRYPLPLSSSASVMPVTTAATASSRVMAGPLAMLLVPGSRGGAAGRPPPPGGRSRCPPGTPVLQRSRPWADTGLPPGHGGRHRGRHLRPDLGDPHSSVTPVICAEDGQHLSVQTDIAVPGLRPDHRLLQQAQAPDGLGDGVPAAGRLRHSP